MFKTLENDTQSFNRAVTQEAEDISKFQGKDSVLACPEPTSEEGWTAVPEAVKKIKIKKNTKVKK